MADITNKKLIILKGILFFVIGTMTAILIVQLTESILVLVLFGVGVWAFCRFYYFLFYVLEKYVGIEGRYAGIADLLIRLLRKGKKP